MTTFIHPDDAKNYKVRRIVFVEGANFVGKTTWLNKEVGEGNYAKDVPSVAVANALQSVALIDDLRQTNIDPNTIADIRRRNRPHVLYRTREVVYFDRGPVSSMVYQPNTEPHHTTGIYPDVQKDHIFLVTSPKNLWRNINQSRRTRDWPKAARLAMFANCCTQQDRFIAVANLGGFPIIELE